MTSPSTPRLLVIGAGSRARQTVLPAVYALRGHIEVVGVAARSSRDVPVAEDWTPTTTTLDDVDLDAVDRVVIAVGTAQVPGILERLSRGRSDHLHLLVDTPVFNARDLVHRRLLKRFATVRASEDTIALPPLVLARRLIEEGRIGELRHVYFMHSGFKHHALASLKMLAGGHRIAAARIISRGAGCAELRVRLPGGVGATILEPRDYGAGRLLICGSRGAIADYELRGEGAPVHRIGYRVENDRYQGLTLDGQPAAADLLDRAYAEAARRLPPVPLMTALKTRGLMQLVADLADPSTRYAYPADEAMSDAMTIAVLNRTGRFRDVGVGRTSAFGALLRLASHVRRGGRD